MQEDNKRLGAPEWLILAGSCGFIFVLALSAYYEADIRWLHFFQAWMYIATIVLALRRNRWGYFIGFSAALLWDYSSVFVTTFFVNGLQVLSALVRTGQLSRPDLLIAVPAWFSNVFVILGCAWAYSRHATKSAADLGRLAVAFILTNGFFVLDIALFQPRYLAIFKGLLHPHLPWPR